MFRTHQTHSSCNAYPRQWQQHPPSTQAKDPEEVFFLNSNFFLPFHIQWIANFMSILNTFLKSISSSIHFHYCDIGSPHQLLVLSDCNILPYQVSFLFFLAPMWPLYYHQCYLPKIYISTPLLKTFRSMLLSTSHINLNLKL